jgi:hypothetical protein
MHGRNPVALTASHSSTTSTVNGSSSSSSSTSSSSTSTARVSALRVVKSSEKIHAGTAPQSASQAALANANAHYLLPSYSKENFLQAHYLGSAVHEEPQPNQRKSNDDTKSDPLTANYDTSPTNASAAANSAAAAASSSPPSSAFSSKPLLTMTKLQLFLNICQLLSVFYLGALNHSEILDNTVDTSTSFDHLNDNELSFGIPRTVRLFYARMFSAFALLPDGLFVGYAETNGNTYDVQRVTADNEFYNVALISFLALQLTSIALVGAFYYHYTYHVKIHSSREGRRRPVEPQKKKKPRRSRTPLSNSHNHSNSLRSPLLPSQQSATFSSSVSTSAAGQQQGRIAVASKPAQRVSPPPSARWTTAESSSQFSQPSNFHSYVPKANAAVPASAGANDRRSVPQSGFVPQRQRPQVSPQQQLYALSASHDTHSPHFSPPLPPNSLYYGDERKAAVGSFPDDSAIAVLQRPYSSPDSGPQITPPGSSSTLGPSGSQQSLDLSSHGSFGSGFAAATFASQNNNDLQTSRAAFKRSQWWVRFFIVSITFLYLPVVRDSLQMAVCDRRFITLTQQCYSGDHLMYLLLVLINFLVYVAGAPLLFLAIIMKYKPTPKHYAHDITGQNGQQAGAAWNEDEYDEDDDEEEEEDDDADSIFRRAAAQKTGNKSINASKATIFSAAASRLSHQSLYDMDESISGSISASISGSRRSGSKKRAGRRRFPRVKLSSSAVAAAYREELLSDFSLYKPLYSPYEYSFSYYRPLSFLWCFFFILLSVVLSPNTALYHGAGVNEDVDEYIERVRHQRQMQMILYLVCTFGNVLLPLVLTRRIYIHFSYHFFDLFSRTLLFITAILLLVFSYAPSPLIFDVFLNICYSVLLLCYFFLLLSSLRKIRSAVKNFTERIDFTVSPLSGEMLLFSVDELDLTKERKMRIWREFWDELLRREIFAHYKNPFPVSSPGRFSKSGESSSKSGGMTGALTAIHQFIHLLNSSGQGDAWNLQAEIQNYFHLRSNSASSLALTHSTSNSNLLPLSANAGNINGPHTPSNPSHGPVAGRSNSSNSSGNAHANSLSLNILDENIHGLASPHSPVNSSSMASLASSHSLSGQVLFPFSNSSSAPRTSSVAEMSSAGVSALVFNSFSAHLPPLLSGFQGTVLERQQENRQIFQSESAFTYHSSVRLFSFLLNSPSYYPLRRLVLLLLFKFHGLDIYWDGPVEDHAQMDLNGIYSRTMKASAASKSLFGRLRIIPFPFTAYFQYDDCDDEVIFSFLPVVNGIHRDSKQGMMQMFKLIEINQSAQIQKMRAIRQSLRCLNGKMVSFFYQKDIIKTKLRANHEHLQQHAASSSSPDQLLPASASAAVAASASSLSSGSSGSNGSADGQYESRVSITFRRGVFRIHCLAEGSPVDLCSGVSVPIESLQHNCVPLWSYSAPEEDGHPLEEKEKENDDQHHAVKVEVLEEQEDKESDTDYEVDDEEDSNGNDIDDDDSMAVESQPSRATGPRFLPAKRFLSAETDAEVDAIVCEQGESMATDVESSHTDKEEKKVEPKHSGAGVIPNTQSAWMNNGVKECVELTMEDGRSVTCTPDHQLLVVDWQTGKRMWKRADEIKIAHYDFAKAKHSASDRVVIGPTNPLLRATAQDRQWRPHFADQFNYSFEQWLAISRMLGMLMTDGSCRQRDRLFIVQLDHELDCEHFNFDYRFAFGSKLSFSLQDRSSEPGSSSVFRARLPVSSALCAIYLACGQEPGDPMVQVSRVPSFIMNESGLIIAPRPIVVEFLAGLWGGDGATAGISHRGKSFGIHCDLRLSRSKEGNEQQMAERLDPYLRNIVALLVQVGISAEHISIDKFSSDRTRKVTSERALSKSIQFRRPGFIQFGELVGYRYCVHKQARLAPILAYMKMKVEANGQCREVLAAMAAELFDKPKQYGVCYRAAISSVFPGQLPIVIGKVLTNKTAKDFFMNRFANRSASNLDEAIAKFTTNSLHPDEWLVRTKAWSVYCDMPLRQYLAMKTKRAYHDYAVRRGQKVFPVFELAVVGRRAAGPKTVYDISMTNSARPSFQVNGIGNTKTCSVLFSRPLQSASSPDVFYFTFVLVSLQSPITALAGVTYSSAILMTAHACTISAAAFAAPCNSMTAKEWTRMERSGGMSDTRFWTTNSLAD